MGWIGTPSLRLDTLSPEDAQERITEMETALLAEYGTLGTFTDDPILPWATAASFAAAVTLGVGLLFGVRRFAGK